MYVNSILSSVAMHADTMISGGKMLPKMTTQGRDIKNGSVAI